MIKPKVISVLVTGANGFVGSALVPELILQGYGVKQLVRTKNFYSNSKIKTFCIDSIDNGVNFKKPLAGVDVVIHLAARVHVMREIYSDALNEYRRINVDATLNLARQAASFGIKRFIFVSSVKVNGELTEKNSQFTADDTPNPADAYSISKMEAETALIMLSKETNMEIVILRPPLIYGPGVKANFFSMMKLLYKNPPLPFGNVKNNRSLVYIYNLVDLILKVIEHPKAAGQIFLVSDDQDISTATLLRSTSFFLGKNIKLFPVPIFVLKAIFFLTGKKSIFQRLVPSLSLDISKTKRLLNWSPPYSSEEGIKATAQDFLKKLKRMPRANKTVFLSIKRAFDLFLVLILTLILFAPFLIISFLIKFTSHGPIFFCSDRIGKNNALFKMPKFRTMYLNTPTVATHLLKDPSLYLTPIGSFLRKTSLDEIPQLWSILVGDMSFIGPRPALFNQYDLIDLRTSKGVHHLTPGLTGWAQVNGRDDLSIAKKVKFDTEYLKKKSLIFDLKILYLTFIKIIQREGIRH